MVISNEAIRYVDAQCLEVKQVLRLIVRNTQLYASCESELQIKLFACFSRAHSVELSEALDSAAFFAFGVQARCVEAFAIKAAHIVPSSIELFAIQVVGIATERIIPLSITSVRVET